MVSNARSAVACAMRRDSISSPAAMRQHAFGLRRLRLWTSCAPSLAVAGLRSRSARLPARAASLEELVSAVVRIKTYINPDGQTVQSLGREREGSGIVIDEDGLVLTIGYLMVEAHAAEVTTNAGRTVAGDDRRLRPRDRLRHPARDPAAQDQAARLRPLGRREGERPGADREPWRAEHGVARARRRQARIRRQLGIPARRGDLHRAAASGLERRRADLARGQASRRRLADRRRRGRRRRRRRPATCSCRSSGCRRSSAT